MIPGTVLRSPGNYPATEKKPCCPWRHGLRPRMLIASVTVPRAPVQVPSQVPIARVTSHSANDKGDNEISEVVSRSPGIYLTAEENLS